jgi:hypothetical protein
MPQGIRPEVQELIDRAASIDQTTPRHDPDRACAAFRRRLAAAGLQRPIWWLGDPVDANTLEIAAGRAIKAWKSGLAPFVPAFAAPFVGAVDLNTDAHSSDEVRKQGSRWSPSPKKPQNGWKDGWQDGWEQGGSAALARTAWADAIGWAALECSYGGPLGHYGADWDHSFTRAIAEISDHAIEALAMYANTSHPWSILTSRPFPLSYWIISASAAYHSALAPPRHWQQRLARAIWDSTTAHDAGLAVACLNLPTRGHEADRLLAVYEPMIEAHEAGAFAHCLLDHALVVLAVPAMWQTAQSEWNTRRSLSRTKGPVLAWPRTRLYQSQGRLVAEPPGT